MSVEFDSPLCNVAAARLSGQQPIGWFSLALTVLAAMRATEAGAGALWLVPAMLGLAERYIAVRIAIDAHLFRQLAEARLNLAQLDEALRTLGMCPARQEGAPLSTRIKGAMTWTRRHTAVVLAQLLSFVVAWAARG